MSTIGLRFTLPIALGLLTRTASAQASNAAADSTPVSARSGVRPTTKALSPPGDRICARDRVRRRRDRAARFELRERHHYPPVVEQLYASYTTSISSAPSYPLIDGAWTTVGA